MLENHISSSDTAAEEQLAVDLSTPQICIHPRLRIDRVIGDARPTLSLCESYTCM